MYQDVQKGWISGHSTHIFCKKKKKADPNKELVTFENLPKAKILVKKI